MRHIVRTIDEHGLKHYYLKRHKAEVEDFFHILREQSVSSDAAEALQLRLLRHQDKLFTFLHYDGVPWNNNNAEHAIKQFAHYRERTVGTVRAQGLHNHLVLLSICQTCRYRDVEFLRFLMSKEQDVDAFCQRKQKRRLLDPLELYPEGFMIPQYVSLQKRREHNAASANGTLLQ